MFQLRNMKSKTYSHRSRYGKLVCNRVDPSGDSEWANKSRGKVFGLNS